MSDEQANQQPQQQFAIQKIYTKDVSFETPNSPTVFTEAWEPELKLDIQTGGKPLAENTFEVVLTLTATTTVKEKTAFLAEVQQAGIFVLSGFEDQHKDHMLGSYCPNILFPYAREVVSDLVGKGGFPQLILQPVNFDAIYAQHLEQQRQQAQGGEQGDSVH